jgi:hypothetical protein
VNYRIKHKGIEVMKLKTNKKQNKTRFSPSQEFAVKTNQVHLGKEGKKACKCQADDTYLLASTVVTEAQIGWQDIEWKSVDFARPRDLGQTSVTAYVV